MSSVLIVSLAAGVILVIGGGLMMYMANLVRNAYELKVQINSDIDERLGKIAEELDKKCRWIKRDVLEELEKIKLGLETDNSRKFNDLAEPVVKRIEELDALVRKERDEWVKAVESDRQNITTLDTKVRTLRRDIKRLEQQAGLAAQPDTASPGLDDAAAVQTAKEAGIAMAATGTVVPEPAKSRPPPGAFVAGIPSFPSTTPTRK
jgi:predicted transcriptional regulator